MSTSLEKIRLGFIKLNETLKFVVEAAVDNTPKAGKTYRYKKTGKLVRCMGNGGKGCAWVRSVGGGKDKQEPFEAFGDELEEVLDEAIDDRVFSEDYTGPRWTYGLRNRPMGMGAQPKGFIIGSDGPPAGRARHGTIQYPRELTKDELYDFELELISGSEVNEAKQRLDSKCWKGYRKKGTKIKGDKRVNNCVKENLANGKSDSKQRGVPTKSAATSNSKLIENLIEEYKKSNQIRFSGKSESARVKMAISDFNRANPRKREQSPLTECMDGGKDIDSMEITRLELDEIADMADDLFAALPNYPEFPAWVGHKIAALHAGLQSVYDYYLLQTSKGKTDSPKMICVNPVNPNITNIPLLPVPSAGI